MKLYAEAATVRDFFRRLDVWPAKEARRLGTDPGLRRDLRWSAPAAAALATLVAVAAVTLGGHPTVLGAAAVLAAVGTVPLLVGGLARRLGRRLEVAITEREVFRAAFDATGRPGEEVRDRANHDHLTGLPNRSLLYDRLARAIPRCHREASQLALLFVDVDDFKGVNDRFGHRLGDRLLVELASRIRMNVRAGDTVARFGGDEFVVLLDGVSGKACAERVAAEVREAVQAPCSFDGNEVTVSVSLAVRVYPGDGTSADELVGSADAAMYGDTSRDPAGPGASSPAEPPGGVVSRFGGRPSTRHDGTRGSGQ